MTALLSVPGWDAIARLFVFGVVAITLLVVLAAAILAIQEHVRENR